jgi:spore maturation protein CgeB
VKRRRVLLASPAFHGYWSSMARALEGEGFDVVPFVYDRHATARAKARVKLRYELPARLGRGEGFDRQARDVTAAGLRALRASAPDAVVVVRGDLLRDEFWGEVAARSLPCVLWLYDELARLDHPIARLQALDAVASYSRRDCDLLADQKVRAIYLPNAFDPTLSPTASSASSASSASNDAVVFIGARYPGRERVLVGLHDAGVPVHAVGRDWSHHPLDRLRTWQLHRPRIPASRDVSRRDAYALMADSPATINLHESQDGFTMRTFEACGVGGLQLIDRANVADLYEPGTEIIPFSTTEELGELCRRATRDRRWHDRVGAAARARTLSEHTFGHRVRDLTAVWR